MHYRFEDKRISFEHAIGEAHRKARLGIFRWVLTVRPLNYLTAPIIYGMIVPLALFDLCISFYQLTCFPIYRVARVRRANYIALDHQHLAYLNIIEKVDCMYCSYAVGLLGYAQEITARTEQYFCPIKHARKCSAPMHATRIFCQHHAIREKLEDGAATMCCKLKQLSDMENKRKILAHLCIIPHTQVHPNCPQFTKKHHAQIRKNGASPGLNCRIMSRRHNPETRAIKK